MNVYISAISSVSAIGLSREEKVSSYRDQRSSVSALQMNGRDFPIYRLKSEHEALLDELDVPRETDRTVRIALLAARQLRAQLPPKAPLRCGVFVGSSRGQTEKIEQFHTNFLATGSTPPLTSPRTTGGILSSSVADALSLDALDMTISVTCSSFLHALLIGSSFIRSKMLDLCVVGAAEAALTPFTIAQMSALGLYSSAPDQTVPPCSPFIKEIPRRNHVALGEGAAFCILTGSDHREKFSGPLLQLKGWGYGRQKEVSVTGMEGDGGSLGCAMKDALREAGRDSADLIVAHAPGTQKGDEAELSAITDLSRDRTSSIVPPLIVGTKHLTGHTFGASGGFSLELAALMMQEQLDFHWPYETVLPESFSTSAPQNALITGAGFGGNVIAVYVEKLTD